MDQPSQSVYFHFHSSPIYIISPSNENLFCIKYLLKQPEQDVLGRLFNPTISIFCLMEFLAILQIKKQSSRKSVKYYELYFLLRSFIIGLTNMILKTQMERVGKTWHHLAVDFDFFVRNQAWRLPHFLHAICLHSLNASSPSPSELPKPEPEKPCPRVSWFMMINYVSSLI